MAFLRKKQKQTRTLLMALNKNQQRQKLAHDVRLYQWFLLIVAALMLFVVGSFGLVHAKDS
jgi:hypothetical protein